MWVRGLKLKSTSLRRTGEKVAPYVGAWIETVVSETMRMTIIVAPYVGAWIETPACIGQLRLKMSHPMWVRGLKLFAVPIVA